MTLQQFRHLMDLTRIKPDSQAAKGAALVLINGITQVKAASMLGCQQCTISAAVRRLREVERIAKRIQ